MLSAADLAGFDLPALANRLQGAAYRHDVYRREAESFDLPGGFLGTHERVMAADADAAAVAEAERLVALLRRFVADEGRARPRAAVTHLRVVPKPEPRPGIFARTMAALGRAPAPSRPGRSEDAA